MRVLALVVAAAVCAPLSAELPLDLARWRARTLGVDHAGHLWAWSPENRTLYSVAPDGRQKTLPADSNATLTAVDSQWGVAYLADKGHILVVQRWDGTAAFDTRMSVPASNLAWVDQNVVAVAPQHGVRQVVLWNIARKQVEREIGTLPELDGDTPGAQFGRATHLRFDSARKELLAFDAYQGELTVYSRTGDVLRRAAIRHGKRDKTDAWLRKLDLQYKQQKQAFRPLMWSFPTLALAQDGTVWVAEENSEKSITLRGIRRDGSVIDKQLEPGCASVRFQVWQKRTIFYRDPESPRPYCVEERKFE